MSKIYVKKSSRGGLGLFAKKPIKKGEVVLVWRGKKLKEKQVTPAMWKEDYLIPISEKEYVYPKGISNYANHSCNPNCGVKGNLALVAMKKIPAGEEITFDYSTIVFAKDWKMKGCKCGSKNCRKTIRGYQFLPKKLKEKYRDFTSKYILEALKERR
jgi:hypothetical protein